MSTWTLKSPAKKILTFNVKIRPIRSEKSRKNLLIGGLFLPEEGGGKTEIRRKEFLAAERVKSKCSNETYKGFYF